MNIRELAEQLIEARSKATQGEMHAQVGYPAVYTGVTRDDGIGGISYRGRQILDLDPFGEDVTDEEWEQLIALSAFFAIAANHVTRLAEAAKRLHDFVEFAASSPDDLSTVQDWANRGIRISEIARHLLAEIDGGNVAEKERV